MGTNRTRFGWRRTAAALLAPALLLTGVAGSATVLPAQASTLDRAHPQQRVFAYVANGMTLRVSAEFLDMTAWKGTDKWDGLTHPDTAVARVYDANGTAQTCDTESYNHTKTVTLSCAKTATTATAGVWVVDLYTQKDGKPLGSTTTGADDSVMNWEIRVENSAGTARSGVVWVETLSMNQDRRVGDDSEVNDNGAVPKTVGFWALSETGVLYRVQYRTFMGLESWITVDDLGVGNASCEPTYQSIEMSRMGSRKLAHQCPDRTRYRIFFETPSTTLPASTTKWGDGRTGDQWVKPEYTDPSLSVAVQPAAGATKTWANARITVTDLTQTGTVKLALDTNSNGKLDESDKLLTTWLGLKAGSSPSYTWDGKDASGRVMRLNETVRVVAELSSVGEIHFLMKDVEILNNGVYVEQLVGPAKGTDAAYALSWDDSALTAWDGSTFTDNCYTSQYNDGGSVIRRCNSSTRPPRTGNKVNTNTTTGAAAHGWNFRYYTTNDDRGGNNQQGTYGDQRYIDNWAMLDQGATATATRTGVLALPEPSVTKTDSRTLVTGGDTLTYTITVRNDSDLVAEPGATVVDHLPADVEFVSAPAAGGNPAGVYSAATHRVTWTGVAVPLQGTVDLPLNVRVKPDVRRGDTSQTGDRYSFTNYVTYTSGDGDFTGRPPADPAAEGCSGPLCFADTDHTVPSNLQVTKTNPVSVVQPGQEITWTLTATNSGTGPEPYTTIVDTLPTWLTFVSASDGGTHNGGKVTWQNLNLAAGATRQVTVTARVSDTVPQPTNLDNSARILPHPSLTAAACPTAPSPTGDSWSTDSGQCGWHRDQTATPELRISKSDGRTLVQPGDELTYTITARNTGAGDETTAVIADTLPAGLDFVSATDGGTWNAAARTVTWPARRINAGQQATVQMVAQVSSTVAQPTNLVNAATVTGRGQTAPTCDTTSADPRCATDIDMTAAPALEVSKTDGHTLVQPGDQLTYTITASNTGAGDETTAAIVDTLPAGLDFVSATDGGTWNAGFNTVTWPVRRINAGQQVTVRVVARVSETVEQPTTLSNLATITGRGQGPSTCTIHSTGNPQCAVDTDTTAAPVLRITKTDNRDLVQPGDELTYTITAQNTGAGDETTAAIVDTLPAGLDFVSATEGATWNAASRTISWAPRRMNAGQQVTMQVVARVSDTVPQPANLRNVATITGRGQTAPVCDGTDPRCAVDSDHTAAPALEVAKTDGRTLVQPGDQVTYQITARNTGAGDETTAVVVDTLPDGLDFVSATGGATWDAGHRTVTWPSRRIDAGQQATMQVIAKVADDVAQPADLVNTATATGRGQTVPACTASTTGEPRCATDTDRTALPLLVVSKDDGRDTVEPGDELTYTIHAANAGEGDETTAVITEHLPPFTQLLGFTGVGDPADLAAPDFEYPDVGAADPDAATYDPATRTLTWKPFRLDSGEVRTMAVTLRVAADVPRPVDLPNVATIAGRFSPAPDCDAAPDDPGCGFDIDDTQPADLRIVKEVLDASVQDGGQVSWRVTVTNLGPARARTVVVHEQMPEQIDPTTVTWAELSAGSVVDGDTPAWFIGELAAGQTVTAKIYGTIADPDLAVGEVLVNTVRVTSPDDLSKGNPDTECQDNASTDSDTDGCDTAQLVPGTSLSVAKDDGLDTVKPGDTATYTIVGTNTGAVVAPEVVLRDLLPAELEFVEASDEGVFDQENRTVTWPAAVVAPQQQIVRTVTVKVATGVKDGTTITNVASISGWGQVPPTCGTGVDDAAAADTEPVTTCASDTDTVAIPKVAIPSGIPGPARPHWWLWALAIWVPIFFVIGRSRVLR